MGGVADQGVEGRRAPGAHHATSCEIRALLVLLAITKKTLKCPDAIGHQVVGLEKVQVLWVSAPRGRQREEGMGRGYIMIDAEVYILTPFLLLLDKASGQAATPGVDNGAALLALDRGVEAEILSTGQAERPEVLLISQLLGAVVHQSLQFGQRLLDLGHGT